MTELITKGPRPPAKYEHKSKKQREKEEEFIASQLSEFQKCVVQIRRISWNRVGKIDANRKKQFVNDFLCQYFIKEDREDVFEGFLRLVVEFGKSTKTNETYVLSLIIEIFYQHVINIITDAEERKFILKQSFPHDSDLYRSALALTIHNLRSRYHEEVACIFSLKKGENNELMNEHIRKLLVEREWLKAILWIEYLDIRQDFHFEEIICELYLDGRFSFLSTFIGLDVARRHRFIQYLDRLLGIQIGTDQNAQFSKRYQTQTTSRSMSTYGSVPLSKLEAKVMSDPKKLERTIVRFVKAFSIGLLADQLAENTLTMRCRDCLMYFHYRWVDKLIPDEEHEEVAMIAMASNSYVRWTYLNMLTRRGFSRKALYFAVALEIPNNELPVNLLRYSCEFPEELKKIQAEVAEARVQRAIVEQAEASLPSELNGIPIVMIDTWEAMAPMLEKLPKESIIGIDAEWKPNYLSISEMVALIQVALPSIIYLVDVVTLEKTLTKEQWLEFFKVLLCCPNNRKIGFDFANDLRVINSSFPFLNVSAHRPTRVICLYRLLTQVVKNPSASKAVFGKEQIEMNINLSEISNFFLNLVMDKTEQQGNWLRRPLRMEQKKYAALDAFTLIKLFEIVAKRLNKLEDKVLLDQFQSAALIIDRKLDAEELVDGAEMAEEDDANNGFNESSPQ